MATTLFVCCLQEIPFHEHTFFEFSAAQFDSVPVVSGLMASQNENKASKSLVFSLDPCPWMMGIDQLPPACFDSKQIQAKDNYHPRDYTCD